MMIFCCALERHFSVCCCCLSMVQNRHRSVLILPRAMPAAHQIPISPVSMASCQASSSRLFPQNAPLSCTHRCGVICKPIAKLIAKRSRSLLPGVSLGGQPRERAGRVSALEEAVKTEVVQLPAHTVAVVGKDGSGKTRLVAELLRLKNGSNEDNGMSSLYLGQPSADQLTSEEDSSHFNTTLYNHLYAVNRTNHMLQVVDCPGHIDRLPQVDIALKISGGAVFVMNMMDEVDEATERVWQRLQDSGNPSAIFVSQVDLGSEADFEVCISSIKDQLGLQPAVLQYPYYNSNGDLDGILDVLNERICTGDQGCLSSQNTPESAGQKCKEMMKDLVEVLAEAEVNEEIMDAYLDDIVPSQEVVLNAVKEAVQSRKIVPVLCGSAAKGMGADALDEFVEQTFPSLGTDLTTPSQWVSTDSDGTLVDLIPSKDAAFTGFVFGAHWNRYSGKCCDVLVLRGSLAPGQKCIQIDSSTKFSTQKIMRWSHVGKLEPVDGGVAYPGDLVVLDHCDDVQVNSTICDPKEPIEVDSLHFEKPRCTYKLDLGKGNLTEDEKVLGALQKMIEEDPSIRLARNEETGELLLSGMGPLHLEVVKERIREEHGIDLRLSTPHVAYHETISRDVNAKGRHKKQSGGHGQFGEIEIIMEPLQRGEGVKFVSQIKGGVIPSALIGSVEKGVHEALKEGPMGGFPVVDVQVTLVDGKTHSVDSGDAAFFQAGILAVREALKKSESILLEPIMKMDADFPGKNTGAVSKDLSRRRGQVIGLDTNGHIAKLQCLVPLSTALGYSSDLQQMTAGLGCFTMELEKYEEVPSNLVQNMLKANSLISAESV